MTGFTNFVPVARGIAVGTYYFRLQNLGTGAAVGTLRVRYEENPATSFF